MTGERERVVGFALAPLETSERGMLKEILRGLDGRFGRPGEWMDILVMDRGYWGAEFLLGLKKDFGMDFVTRARSEDLDVVRYIEEYLPPADTWKKHKETRSRLGEITVECAGMEKIPLYKKSGKEVLGYVNAVIADEKDGEGKPLVDEKGEKRPRFYYITSLGTSDKPYDIRRHYISRWMIENQGFRELTQNWKIDNVAGRRFNAIYARIGFVLMLYNAERIMRMKYPGFWADEKEKLRKEGGGELIGGLSVIAYCKDGSMGLFGVKEYGEIVRECEKSKVKREIEDKIKEALKKGMTLEEFARSNGIGDSG